MHIKSGISSSLHVYIYIYTRVYYSKREKKKLHQSIREHVVAQDMKLGYMEAYISTLCVTHVYPMHQCQCHCRRVSSISCGEMKAITQGWISNQREKYIGWATLYYTLLPAVIYTSVIVRLLYRIIQALITLNTTQLRVCFYSFVKETLACISITLFFFVISKALWPRKIKRLAQPYNTFFFQ